jgi:GNAT superfamily N-acetyltransferase
MRSSPEILYLVPGEHRQELDAIGRLRAQVWLQDGYLTASNCPDGVWLDEYERQATHLFIREAGELIASARFSLHDTIETTSHAAHLRAASLGTLISTPFALLSRLVVAPPARRRGIARTLDEARLVLARQYDAKAAISFATSWRRPALERLGFECLAVLSPMPDLQRGLAVETHVMRLFLASEVAGTDVGEKAAREGSLTVSSSRVSERGRTDDGAPQGREAEVPPRQRQR